MIVLVFDEDALMEVLRRYIEEHGFPPPILNEDQEESLNTEVNQDMITEVS